MTGDPAPRSRIPFLLVAVGAVLAVVAVTGFLGSGRDDSWSSTAPAAQSGALDELVDRAQTTLRRDPDNAPLWAQLGAAYVEKARISGNPSFYASAQGALERSTTLRPDGNGDALIGLGQLANARHDFAAGRRFGEQARTLRPSTPEVYGVLADAYTQLGDSRSATAAVQRMLDVRPGLAAFTRASYDLELQGRIPEARTTLERALSAAISPDDAAFCRYYLGELAWNSGDVVGAAEQYRAGLEAAPQNVALAQGRAKVAYAQGRVDEALAGYADVTTRTPLPQYLQEYAQMLEATGRVPEARVQYGVLDAQQRLYASAGSTDVQVTALIAADHGNPAEALRLAQAEWGRRQSVFSADTLAWALHVNGRDGEALTYADRATSLGWRNASYTYHRGMILAGLGRRDEALTELQQALAINPHFSPLDAPRAVAAVARLGAAT